MRVVFVSGCFDALHRGHTELFTFAKSLGDFLYVSVASDRSIRLLKQREPIYCEEDRQAMVAALRAVDLAFISNTKTGNDDCFQVIRELLPDIWVFNADDANAEDKRCLAEELGIEVVYNQRPQNWHSTSGLIERIKAAR